MIEVKLRPGQSIQAGLSIFKRRIQMSGLMEEIQRREFHRKPSQMKRWKKRRAKKRLNKSENQKPEDY